MTRFSTAITISGERVETSVPRGTRAWHKANSVFCPLGPAPMRAWLVLTKRALDNLQITTEQEVPEGEEEPEEPVLIPNTHSIAWKQIETEENNASNPTETILTFSKLYVVGAEKLLIGGVGDLDALYLLELADARWLVAKNSDSGLLRVNLRSYANEANFLTGTRTTEIVEEEEVVIDHTWDSLLTLLWDACEQLGNYPGLPAELPIDGKPESTWILGQSAYQSLNAILDHLDCALCREPFTGVFSIVQLGDTQTVAAAATTLKWSAEPANNNSDAAANLNIYHIDHCKAYGQERDTEIETNWAVTNPTTPEPRPTEIEGASGTLPVWDDLPRILDENGELSNEAAITERDENRLERYVTRHTVSSVHRIHIGLSTLFMPGAQIRAVLWRNYDDGQIDSLGGTCTEFVCGTDLIYGLGESEGQANWLETPVTLPRENYLPPDLGRRSYPNYPRLPNIVQVFHDEEEVEGEEEAQPEAGDILEPDGILTITSEETDVADVVTKFHKGRVKRWVSNSMVTLDPCWILFVDDFDNQRGNILAKQGDYYGPARLSGVTTINTGSEEEPVSTMLPVYTVSKGEGEETIVFELVEDINLSGSAIAKVLQIDSLGAYVDASPEIDVIVVDPFAENGCWQGYEGYRGLARKRTDKESIEGEEVAKYDIIFMERAALIIEFTLYTRMGETVEGSEPQKATATVNAYYQQGGKRTPEQLIPLEDPLFRTTVHDRQNLFPYALVGAKGKAIWDDVLARYEISTCQQRCFIGRAIADDVGGIGAYVPGGGEGGSPTGPVRIRSFIGITPPPFNQQPVPLPTVGINFFNHKGKEGAPVLMVWDETQSGWLIINVGTAPGEDDGTLEVVVDLRQHEDHIQVGVKRISVRTNEAQAAVTWTPKIEVEECE